MGPGVIGAGVVQINLFADMIIASFLDTGAISVLYYADRLNQLPLGMIGIAIGTTLLPMLSRALSSDDTLEARKLFNRALEICLVIGLPAAAGLFIIAQPIISLLFERGAFTAEAAIQTATVLKMYVIGLPAYVIIKVYSAAFWSRQDTVTPVKIAVLGTLLNIAMGLIFIFALGYGVEGIALATSIAGWVQLFCLAFALRGEKDMILEPLFYSRLMRIILSVVVMAISLYAANLYLIDLALLPRVLSFVFGAKIIYAASIMLTGAVNMDDVKLISKKR
jgi:putative peptidoglycan lipid II flippase